jgi:hypothetical protein
MQCVCALSAWIFRLIHRFAIAYLWPSRVQGESGGGGGVIPWRIMQHFVLVQQARESNCLSLACARPKRASPLHEHPIWIIP